MDQSTAARGVAADRGVSSVQFLLASALSLMVFLAFANLMAVQYGRGAIRSALDQGARAGALTGSSQACEAAAHEVLGQLLGGRMGDSVDVVCSQDNGLMTATAGARFESWTPMTADFDVSISAQAVMEPVP